MTFEVGMTRRSFCFVFCSYVWPWLAVVGNRRMSDWLVQTIPDQKKTEEGLRMFLCFTLASTGRELHLYNPIVTLAKSRRKTNQEDDENYPTRVQNYAKNLFKTTPGGVWEGLGPHVGPKWKKVGKRRGRAWFAPSYFGVVFVLLLKTGIPNL